ncbi:MAG: phosphatase PAP2 family protein [Saprospiraceae bacterium]|nr:phosphatase PAP2 family protein [Saprospiraceae bacterium]
MQISKKQILGLSIFGIVYLSWFYFVVGLRPEHTLLLVGFIALYLFSSKTRKVFLAYTPAILYLTAYDSLRAFPNYMYNKISIKEIYDIEKAVFGVYSDGKLLTLNEFLLNYQNDILYLISGASYLTWVPGPLLFSLWLFFTKRKKVFVNFMFLFVLTNLIGFIGYYLYPAAPPWYVEMYGFEFLDHVTGEATRLSNFDAIVGFPIFEGIYSKNANVFAAVPSIHAANPFACFLASLQLKGWKLKTFFFFLTCGMWFGALYSNHHYLIDVVCGAFVVVIAYGIVYYLLRKTKWNKYLLDFEKMIF